METKLERDFFFNLLNVEFIKFIINNNINKNSINLKIQFNYKNNELIKINKIILT